MLIHSFLSFSVGEYLSPHRMPFLSCATHRCTAGDCLHLPLLTRMPVWLRPQPWSPIWMLLCAFRDNLNRPLVVAARTNTSDTLCTSYVDPFLNDEQLNAATFVDPRNNLGAGLPAARRMLAYTALKKMVQEECDRRSINDQLSESEEERDEEMAAMIRWRAGNDDDGEALQLASKIHWVDMIRDGASSHSSTHRTAARNIRHSRTTFFRTGPGKNLPLMRR